MKNNSRDKFRALLAGGRCTILPSVYDPISVRIAESLGFECGIVGGSMVSLSVLGAPDITLITLTELVEQVTRVTRASSLPVIVDSDHGYGNALNVMRTVVELERAGVAAITIEDTLLPQPFGVKGEKLISIEEGAAKIRAAVKARTDPSLSILARTHALRATDMEDALKRCAAYTAAGADALFLLGAKSTNELADIHAKFKLPLVLAQYDSKIGSLDDLASAGVRAALQGHQAFWGAAKAIEESMRALKEGRAQSTLNNAPADESKREWSRLNEYDEATRQFLA